jgi:hypothetical protein
MTDLEWRGAHAPTELAKLLEQVARSVTVLGVLVYEQL